MVPTKTEFVPSVAELLTCQKTLHGFAPLTSKTLLAEAVIRVLFDWKINTALESPLASRVRVPVMPRVAPVYRPGTRVRPPSSVATAVPPVRPAASLYAAVRSFLACKATASALWSVPLSVPGGNPVTAVPGLTPRSPLMTVGPVLVTVEPASTAKLAAVRRLTDGTAAAAGRMPTATAMRATRGRTRTRVQRRLTSRRILGEGAGKWMIRCAMRLPCVGGFRSRGDRTQGQMAAASTL